MRSRWIRGTRKHLPYHNSLHVVSSIRARRRLKDSHTIILQASIKVNTSGKALHNNIHLVNTIMIAV